MANTLDYYRAAGMVIDTEYVTPANTTLNQYDCLWVNNAGNVALKVPGRTTVQVFENLNAGQFLPVNTNYVMTTSTTATPNIIGCILGREKSNPDAPSS